MRTVQQMYLDTKSVQNFSSPFKVDTTILQTLFDQVNTNGRENFNNNFLRYQMPLANLTNSYYPFTTNGRMAAAMITQAGNVDNIVVDGTGTNTDSYVTPNKNFSGCTYLRAHAKIKVKALGTTPVIGWRTIGVGAPYTSFVNSVRSFYANLNTGAVTASATTFFTASSNNQFSGAVAVDEVVDVYLEYWFMQQWRFRVVRRDLTGQVSEYIQTISNASASTTGLANFIRFGLILHDGTYQLLEFDIQQPNQYGAKIAMIGDSILTGQNIAYSDTIQYKLQQLLPGRVSQFAGSAALLAGMQSVLGDMINSSPEICFLDNALDAMYQGKVNPASPNHATWSAAFNSLVNLIITAGITPICFIPSCTVLYTENTKQLMIDYWTTNFPDYEYVTTIPSECSYDNTGFHYNGATNQIVADRLVALLVSLNLV